MKNGRLARDDRGSLFAAFIIMILLSKETQTWNIR